MIRTELETKRLRLRLFNSGDAQAMYRLSSDPEVIKYAEARPVESLEEARQRLEAGPLSDYRKYGYGRFALELKETGQVIGFCGIKFIPEIDLPEIGYRLEKRYWGQGYGTEAAKACVAFAREDLQLEKIVALIMPENAASIRIAEKLGMARGPLIHIDDVDAFQYELRLVD